MEKFIPYEKLSKKGSNPTAAGGGSREGSEWQRSARCKSALPDAASAGHRNRAKRKMDLTKRQTWGELNPVTRKPQNSKAYNRKRTQKWKKELPDLRPFCFHRNISFKSDRLSITQSATVFPRSTG